MPNPFAAGNFPGQAIGKGNANVIDEDFAPETAPPVDVEDVPETHPVDPTTGFPTIPVEDALANAGLYGDDLPDNVPEDVFDILF